MALRRLIDEAQALADRLRQTADRVHADEELTAGERRTLMDLASRSPQTVPALARARPASRQHMQTVVNGLRSRGLATLADNPRHLRSKLVDLTESGREASKRLRAREGQVLTGLSRDLDPAALTRAADTLAEIARRLDRPPS